LDVSCPFLIGDWLRAISKKGYFWINELYPSLTQWKPEIPSDKIVSWLWSAIACGAKGIMFWQFKKERLGQETFDAGIVEPDGRENKTSLALRKVFSVIRTNESLFASTQVPRANVVLVYDFGSDLVSRIEESDHLGDLSLVRKDSLSGGYMYKTALQGAYHLFWQAGIQVDMISSHDLSGLTDYEVAYFPTMFMVDKKQAEMLKNYVKQGGQLIAEGGMGQRDGNTWLHTSRPGAGLDELFGLTEVERVVCPDDQRQISLPTGKQVFSGYMNASFSLTTGKPLAIDSEGRIVMAENRLGDGRAIMTGFSAGLAYLLTSDLAWVDYFRWLITDWASVKLNLHEMQDGLYVRKLESVLGDIFFLFNVRDDNLDWIVHDRCIELVSNKRYDKNSIVTVAPGKVAVLLKEKSFEKK